MFTCKDVRRALQMLERESKAAIDQEAAEAQTRAEEDMLLRQEEIRKHQAEELEEHKRQLDEQQEHIKREAELARYTFHV